jgi:formamidopyrimidine-DNA glycosylase
MPELPEVETVRRGLEPILEGRRLDRVEQRRPDLRFPFPARFAERLTGRRVTALDRRGKVLLVHLDDGHTWLVHLGMSGCFRIDGPGGTGDDDKQEDKQDDHRHDHLIVETSDGRTLRFHDPRRFGFMDLLPTASLSGNPFLASLGPDPFSTGFDAAWLARACRARRAPLKAVLLDQAVVAGMGNIYASESLFRARLSPERPAATLNGRQTGRLARAIRAVFSEAIAAGGSTLRNHRQPSGELGCFQHAFAVYGRAGLGCPGCRCDPTRTGGIRRIVQSGRSTYFCADRQR